MKRLMILLMSLVLAAMLSACGAADIKPTTLADTGEAFRGARYSPDGTKILTFSGGTVHLLDATGKTLGEFEPGNVVFDANFSPDGQFIVTASNDSVDDHNIPQQGIVHIWDYTGKPVMSFPQAIGVYRAVYSPDGTKLLIARQDNMAVVQDVAHYPTTTDTWGVNLVADDTAATSTVGQPITLDYASMRSAMHLLQNPITPRYNVNIVLSAVPMDACVMGDVKINRWQVNAQVDVTDTTTSASVLSQAFAGEPLEGCPDSKATPDTPPDYVADLPVASVMASTIATALETLPDALPKGVLMRLTGGSNPQDWIYDAVFSADGSAIATAEGYGTVYVWNSTDATVIQALYGHSAPVRGISFSPDGSLLATAGEDNMVTLWNRADGVPLFQLTGKGAFNDVAFSPNGRYVVTAGENGSLLVWNTSDGKQALELKGHTGSVASAVFSPDGNTILSAGDTVMRWDVSSLNAGK